MLACFVLLPKLQAITPEPDGASHVGALELDEAVPAATPTPRPQITPTPIPYDFNKDGHPDYVLTAGRVFVSTAIWYLNNNVYLSGAFGPALPSVGAGR